MTLRKGPHWPTEAEMCAAFISALKKGWTAYPETAGWDLLLVRNSDGFQVGIEAKLRLNAKVLDQALTRMNDEVGPDCRAVLVPDPANQCLKQVAEALGVQVITIRPTRTPAAKQAVWARPALPEPNRPGGWHEWVPERRCPLPSYVPDVAAGRSRPVKLTAWKISAIKITVLLDVRGFVTRADFKSVGIDHRRWVAPRPGWLRKGEADGWVRGKLPDFARQHPTNYAEIRADIAAWAS